MDVYLPESLVRDVIDEALKFQRLFCGRLFTQESGGATMPAGAPQRNTVLSCPAVFTVVRERLFSITGQMMPQHEASDGHNVTLIISFEVLVHRPVPAGTRALSLVPSGFARP